MHGSTARTLGVVSQPMGEPMQPLRELSHAFVTPVGIYLDSIQLMILTTIDGGLGHFPTTPHNSTDAHGRRLPSCADR